MNATAHPFLKRFTAAGRERLLGCMAGEDHPAGAYLFHEGDAADGFYLVLKGQVEIVRAAGAHEKILSTILAGDYFGEVAVLDGFGRSAAARAVGAISVAKIPRNALLEVLATEPGNLTLGFLQHVLAHLREANNLVVREVVHKEKLSLVGEMASSLMHDLGTPLSSIRLSADLINANSPGGKVPQWCDGIRRQCDRVVGMAAELMEFSKGESRLDVGPTTTTAFLRQFQTLNEGCLTPAGIEILVSAKPAKIEIDSMRLQRVLQNLVKNAIEALHATPKPRIEIAAAVKDGVFHLTVRDNGPGIPEAIQSQLFEPFVTHGKREGVGLGMAIVRSIVTAHGGAITFQTAPGQGTTFLICLPQKKSIRCGQAARPAC
jgi:signal transduction histidine kinase